MRRHVATELGAADASRPGERDPFERLRRLVEVPRVQPEVGPVLGQHRGLAVPYAEHDCKPPAPGGGDEDHVAGSQRCHGGPDRLSPGPVDPLASLFADAPGPLPERPVLEEVAQVAGHLVPIPGQEGPVVLEPVFNHFEPLEDEGLANELRAVAERAGVPVRDVLVADASRRTTKVNAYVSGIGATRRVVLFDTLLESADEGQLKLVVAHELGHRRERHVVKLTLGVMAAVALWIVLLWAILGDRAASPRNLPLVLLVSTALRTAVLPFGAWVSRRFERVADRFSLELTRDLPAYERTHLGLARKNLGDLEPPKLAYVLLFSHPTTPERLAYGRAWTAA